MEQTTNYQLNQWDKSDRIMMEDFNADNAKLEAALAALRADLTAEGSTRASAVAAEAEARSAADTAEASARQAAVTAEETARKNAVAAEASARQAADTAEAEARTAADTALEQRIDALAPYAGAQFIRTVTLETSGTYVTLNLGDIDWNAWKAVHLSLDIYMASSGSATVVIGGENTGSIAGNTTAPDSSAGRKLGHVIFYPLFDSRHSVCPLVMSSDTAVFGYNTAPYSSLSSISFRNTSTQILAGTKCDIWGEK